VEIAFQNQFHLVQLIPPNKLAMLIPIANGQRDFVLLPKNNEKET